MLVYPSDSPPAIRTLSSLEAGDPLTTSELTFGCHTGTHVDAPAHFLPNGLTVDQLDRSHFFGPARVIEFPDCNSISRHQVAGLDLPGNHHILIKTRNSALLHGPVFHPDHCYLLPEAVELLLHSGPLSIGFDYYSLDPPSHSDFPSHLLLARHGRPAFVCLDLSHAHPGVYTFLAFPLPVQGAEGMPVRAFLHP